MKTRTLRQDLAAYLMIATLVTACGAIASIARADETAEPRLTTTSQGQGIQRGGTGAGTTSHDEFSPLVTEGERARSTRGSRDASRSSGNTKGGAAAESAAGEFWVYDASVDLYGDVDGDGYWSGIDLMFDVDSVFAEADVYAVLYLSYENGPWNEYASTDDFTIFGASDIDEYVVESDLVSGYPSGDYDLLIEIFDVLDGSFVAEFGPVDTSNLAFLPLEDIGRDTPIETTIVISDGGGGAFGSFGVLALVSVLGFRRMREIRSSRTHDFS